VRAQDGHRLPVDAQRAQELQLLRLALHGCRPGLLVEIRGD
jgi:hypothetical protein